MPNAFVRKLRRFAKLTDAEVAALLHLSANPVARTRGEELIRQGDRPDRIQILVSGWGCRYKILEDGARQILAYLLPGDLCDIHASLLSQMDHHVVVLSNAEVAAVPVAAVHDAMEHHRRIERAMWCSTLVDEAILREWLVGLGRRESIKRTGHRLCEIRSRLETVGMVDRNGEFEMPLTQQELADSLGLTSVHVNRTMSRLRERGIIEYERRRMRIAQPERLAKISGFDPAYLHPCAPAAASEARPLYA